MSKIVFIRDDDTRRVELKIDGAQRGRKCLVSLLHSYKGVVIRLPAMRLQIT
jgi:hypothetical protein